MFVVVSHCIVSKTHQNMYYIKTLNTLAVVGMNKEAINEQLKWVTVFSNKNKHREKNNIYVLSFLQKADGTCNTNFKKTKHREQVMQALEDFVGGNTQILVSRSDHSSFLSVQKRKINLFEFFFFSLYAKLLALALLFILRFYKCIHLHRLLD